LHHCFDSATGKETHPDEKTNNVFTRHRKKCGVQKKERKEYKVKDVKRVMIMVFVG
jgi:hypothetical protein